MSEYIIFPQAVFRNYVELFQNPVLSVGKFSDLGLCQRALRGQLPRNGQWHFNPNLNDLQYSLSTVKIRHYPVISSHTIGAFSPASRGADKTAQQYATEGISGTFALISVSTVTFSGGFRWPKGKGHFFLGKWLGYFRENKEFHQRITRYTQKVYEDSMRTRRQAPRQT